MSKRTLALIAAFLVALFYAGNFSIAKGVTPEHVGPFGLTWFRVLITGIIFWTIFLVSGVREKIDRADWRRIAVAAFCGVGFNMITFLWGLSMTSPISASVLMVTTPLIVPILAVYFFKDSLNWIRILGILIGFAGAVYLILTTASSDTATNPVLGNLLVFVNSISYAFYIVLVKKLTAKYHPLVLLPLLYTFGILYITPFGLMQGLAFDWASSIEVYLGIGYVILFATVGTYLLNLFAIRTLKPSVVAVFVYLQPLLASSIAIAAGTDVMSWNKALAGLLIFTGVYLTSLDRGGKAAVKS